MSDLGELLRQARVYKGASLRDAERATRISRTYLEALENQDYAQLPPPAYARGIVKNYSQYLGLDPAAILSLYDSSDNESVGETIQVVPATRSMDSPSHWVPNFAIIGFMLVVSAIVFAWIYSAWFQPDQTDPNLAGGFPTVTPIGESLLSAVILTPADTEENQDQAGGQEAEPTATPTPEEPTPTEVVVEPTATEVPTQVETSDEPEVVVTEPVQDDTIEGVETADGLYEFVFVATDEVWFEVYLDWSASPTWDGTLYAGESISFTADVATVYSGQAGFLQVYVDGVAYGVLSESWNATVTLP